MHETIQLEQITGVTQLLAEMAITLSRADYATVRLLNNSGDSLDLMAYVGYPPKHEEIPLDGTTLCGHVAMTGQGAICPRVEDCLSYAAWEPEVGSCMAVPLKHKENVIGTLYVESKKPEAFSARYQLDLLQALASQAAIAIENARLHERRVEDIAAMQEVNDAVVSKGLKDVLHLVVKKAVEVMPGQYGQLWLREPETGDLVLEVSSLPEIIAQIQRLKAGTQSINIWVADKGQVYVCHDSQTDPMFFRIYAESRSSVTAPLRYRDEVIGTLNVESPNVGAFAEEHGRLLLGLADQAAIAIENSRLFRETNEWAERLQLLQTVTTAIAAEPPRLDNVAPLIVNGLGRIFKGSSCAIRLYDPNRDEFAPRIATGLLREPVSRAPRSDGTSQWAVRTKRSRYLDEDNLLAPSDGGPAIRREFVDSGVRAAATLPLVSDRQVVGILYLYLTRHRTISERDQQILQLFADQAAIAIENTRLFEGMERRSQQLEKLHHSSLQVNSTLHVDKVLQSIAQVVCELLEADSSTIFLYDKARNELEQRAYADIHGQNATRPLDRELAKELMKNQNPVFKSDQEMTSEERVLVAGKPIHSYASIPLLFDSVRLGLLLIHYRQDHPFTAEEKRVAHLFGLQAAIAINNAHQFEVARRLATIERWAELGQLAGSLAHRIGNKGGTVRLKANELEKYLEPRIPDDPEVTGMIEDIRRNNQYLLDLSHLLFKPLHASDEGMSLIDITLLLQDAIGHARIPGDVTVVTSYADDIPRVRANRFFIEVFLEVIMNAVEAMQHTPTKILTIRADHNDAWIEVSFSDTGVGISEENGLRIFDLFEVDARKAESNHFGFGLWWTRTFLRDIGGDIHVARNQDVGTTFTIRLPKEERRHHDPRKPINNAD